MKTLNLSGVGLVAAFVLPLFSGYGQSPDAAIPASTAALATSTNNPAPPAVNVPASVAEVVKLSSAGLGNDVVLAFVKSSRSAYNLSANDVLRLKGLGVSAPVIAAMLNHDASLREPKAPRPPPVSTSPSPPPGKPAEAGPPPAPPESLVNPDQFATVPPPAPVAAVDAPPVPPAQVEYVPVAPGPDYYWAPGYWWWNGGWIWIGGGWWPRGYGWGHHGGWGYHGGGGYGYHGGGGGFRGGHR